MATRAAVFTDATSESNVTNPSHVSILSGLPSIAHGVFHNARPLPEGIDTLARALQRRGYYTSGLVSVRHVGEGIGWRGFDELPTPHRPRSAQQITDLAVEAFAHADEGPVFVWAHYWEPHSPYRPPEDAVARFYKGDPRAGSAPLLLDEPFFRQPLAAKLPTGWLEGVRDLSYARALYAAEIHQADREIGRLLATLEERGLDEHLIVVVVGDHGESLGEHGIFFDHAGLYENSLRVPLLIRVPGEPPGRYDAPVSTLDIAPTLAQLLDAPLQHPLPGRSLVALIRGETGGSLESGSDRLLIHMHSHNRAVAVREGRWKLIWPIEPDGTAVRTAPELFDLEADPEEQNNLAEREPERVATLRARIEPWTQLGVVRQQAVHLSPDARRQLESLGYGVE